MKNILNLVCFFLGFSVIAAIMFACSGCASFDLISGPYGGHNLWVPNARMSTLQVLTQGR